MSYFPEPHTYSKNKIEVELDLSDHEKKSNVKNPTVLIHQILLKKMLI